MDVDPRHRLLDRPAERDIGGAGVFRMDAALQADFGRATRPGLFDAPDDLNAVKVIGPAAQVFAELTLREGAELAAKIADVGVVDVAGHDIADGIAIDPLPQLVGSVAYRGEGRAACLEELNDVGFVKRLAG